MTEVRVFFSYSHVDEALRDELEKHLSLLKREQLIESWHDRRIDAGDGLDHAIDRQLETANIILLLISSNFIASNYCFDVEMQRAMQRHTEGSARVIPVILHPCDWHSAPFGKLMAVPGDGKPITKFPNLHDGFLEVAKAIRKIVEPMAASALKQTPAPNTARVSSVEQNSVRSSNLRIKKSFNDHDRDKFLEDSFEFLAKFFEASLEELNKRSPIITTRFRRIDALRFTAYIYKNGDSVSECAVFMGSLFGKGIAYSSSATSTNSMNDSVNVVDDGTSLFLTSSMSSAFGGTKGKWLTFEGAAELFWEHLIQRLQ